MPPLNFKKKLVNFMTGNECLASALALMYCNEEDSGEYAGMALPVLNLLIAETFAINNSLREAAGLDPLVSIPSINSLNDEIPCQERILRIVLPYGLAGALMGEDDAALSTQYKNKYEYERVVSCRAGYADVTDSYLGEDA